MKKIVKTVLSYWTLAVTFAATTLVAHAAPTPTPTSAPGSGNTVTIDENGLKQWIKSIVQPITNVALFVIPLIAVATTLISFAQWFALDDQEKQQRPFSKVLKRNGLALIVAESIPVLLKFIGY